MPDHQVVPLTTVTGWRDFVQRLVVPPTMPAPEQWAALDDDQRADDAQERIGYHAELLALEAKSHTASASSSIVSRADGEPDGSVTAITASALDRMPARRPSPAALDDRDDVVAIQIEDDPQRAVVSAQDEHRRQR